MEYLDASAASQAENPEILKVINLIPIFAGVGLHEQHLIARRCHITNWDTGEIIIEQDDVGDHIYAIIDGMVEISRRHPSQGWVKINTLSAGDVFGEIAILKNIPRTARVTALTPCTLLTMSGDDFLEIYQYFPPDSRDNIQLVVAKRLDELAYKTGY